MGALTSFGSFGGDKVVRALPCATLRAKRCWRFSLRNFFNRALPMLPRAWAARHLSTTRCLAAFRSDALLPATSGLDGGGGVGAAATAFGSKAAACCAAAMGLTTAPAARSSAAAAASFGVVAPAAISSAKILPTHFWKRAFASGAAASGNCGGVGDVSAERLASIFNLRWRTTPRPKRCSTDNSADTRRCEGCQASSIPRCSGVAVQLTLPSPKPAPL